MGLNGLIIAAPSSGAGKTMVTLGLLRALRRTGVDICSAKSGPDYIDPAFHAAATGKACVNLDAWAMEPDALRAMAHRQDHGTLLIEGAMGLFDAAPVAGDPMGHGSVADLAIALKLPVVLVLDVARQAQSIAAVIAGMISFRPEIHIAGVILNRVGSDRHRAIIERAISGVRVLGAIPRDKRMARESRHLGLVQAGEDAELESFVEGAADVVKDGVDLGAVLALTKPVPKVELVANTAPFGQRIAVARDLAFAFTYPHMLERWRAMGAEVSFFSPLADEAPGKDADAVFLPGGYPELHAERLAANSKFRAGMLESKALIYGECGGYMVLGRGLMDAQGKRHEMLGLLPVETAFNAPKLTLGYRDLHTLSGPWKGRSFKAHEFHYASVTTDIAAPNLFAPSNSMGEKLETMGHQVGTVSGSFAHLIC